jgi:hypothetical protein
MRSRDRLILPALAIMVALAWADRPSFALPPISFSGGRPAKINEQPVIPLPDLAPLPPAQADSIIVAISKGEKFPETRYDIFDVDLDDDGKPEQIAQITRITAAGWPNRSWWGVYAGGRLDQVVYWNYPEQRENISKIQFPGSFRDSADSLGFVQSVPEFYPASDIVKYADLTGDGKPEYVVWMVGRATTPSRGTGLICPVILSPTPDGYKEVFRTWTTFVVCRVTGPGQRSYEATCRRLHTRTRKTGLGMDLLLEKVALPVKPDSLCRLVGQDERFLPRDPDEWMPLKPMASSAPVPKDWMIARWDGVTYQGLQFVRDVKLD